MTLFISIRTHIPVAAGHATSEFNIFRKIDLQICKSICPEVIFAVSFVLVSVIA